MAVPNFMSKAFSYQDLGRAGGGGGGINGKFEAKIGLKNHYPHCKNLATFAVKL